MVTPADQRKVAQIEDIESEAERSLGDLRSPNFRAVARTLERGWVDNNTRLLFKMFWVRDLTEPNNDSAFFLDLLSDSSRLLCAISAVGPFWAVARFGDQSVHNVSTLWDLIPLDSTDVDVQAIWPIVGYEKKFCDKSVLSKRRVFDVPENEGLAVPAYKIVFSFGQDLPWWD